MCGCVTCLCSLVSSFYCLFLFLLRRVGSFAALGRSVLRSGTHSLDRFHICQDFPYGLYWFCRRSVLLQAYLVIYCFKFHLKTLLLKFIYPLLSLEGVYLMFKMFLRMGSADWTDILTLIGKIGALLSQSSFVKSPSGSLIELGNCMCSHN